jgi:NitT/TauT family transport system substrate-binding protein
VREQDAERAHLHASAGEVQAARLSPRVIRKLRRRPKLAHGELAKLVGVRVVAVGLAVLACASAAPARAADVVRVGDVTSLATAPLYVAIDRGYMKEQGIDVVVERFAGAGKMNVAFAAGQLDVGTGTANAGLFNSLAQGFDVRIVADKGQLRAPASPNKLLARKDLAESGKIKSPKDFKGRKIALLVKGNVQDYQIAKLLEHDGITLKDVEIVYIGSPQTLQAFASKAIDGAHMIEPWVTKAVADGLAVVVADSTSVPEVRQFQNAVILYAGKFIRDRRAIAQRFMNAYVKGIEYVTKQGWKDNGVVDAIFKHTGVEQDLLKRATPPYIAPDGRPDVESLARFQDWLVEQGMVTKKVPMDQVLDLSFLPPAT